jgi:PAS domain S-box-containing protein
MTAICRNFSDQPPDRVLQSATAWHTVFAICRGLTERKLSLSYRGHDLRIAWEDGERIFCRGWQQRDDGSPMAVLLVLAGAAHAPSPVLDRFAHEYALKDVLDGAWAARPLALEYDGGRAVLTLEDPGGEPLDQFLGPPMELGRFLRLAITIASALGKLHRCGLVHKDLKPGNVLVNRESGGVKLTGFGIASRLVRERQAPEPPETIAGTLAYMAPEQTGRMNRSIDSRADLYVLGVTLYQMLTGSLPFTAADPMEWVHCHIARKPAPPRQRREDVPAAISAIIMKLLAKTAEDRYQTAGGVERDLRRCLVEWEARGTIDDFAPGQQDTPDRLLIPEKLYGREREVETLLAAFDRIVNGGAPELVLVAGYSGIGKSSVVNELHKVLVPPRGLFASGKFDQYKRDIPYATLAQAFQSLVHLLLVKSDAELASWRHALRETLDPNGQLMVDLVPDLKLIIGDQPAVPELPPQDAKARFQLVFRRFIGVFARPEHPLALFLDDLQWLDAATLDLIEDLLTRSDLQHLILIGAYRDNEVDAAHPLARKLQTIRNAGATVSEITLAPLARAHLSELIADALRCDAEHAAPLARLVQERTGGNPFFSIQFLSALADEGLLRFDHDAARWSWDLDRIHAKGYTDNVADLMVGKLARLPIETQKAMQQLACVGNAAEITMLSIAFGMSEEQVHADLWEAVRLELVERTKNSYKFAHDRVQEAAYSLIPEASRAAAHLRIGRLLAMTLQERRQAAIFEIVSQFNRGAALITSRDEREQVAELNLLAGKRAKASTAYASALAYLKAGGELLAEDRWTRRHELSFQLELQRAECEFLTGAMADAEERLEALSTHVATTVERAAVAGIRIELYITLSQIDHAIAVGLDYLRSLDIAWPLHPTDEEVRREYQRIWSQLGDRTIEDLIELPLMSDPASLATMEVLIKTMAAAYWAEANLFAFITCWTANLSLEQGNSDVSCVAYGRLGMIAGPRFGDYDAGFRFGQLGCELVEKCELRRFQARVYMNFGDAWKRHIRTGRDLIRRAFETANRIGDVVFAAYGCFYLNTNLLAAGDALGDVQREAENGLDFVRKARFGLVVDIITGQLQLVRTLRGLTPRFGSFDDEQFDELRFERQLASGPQLALRECLYWIPKLQARFFAADYASALEAESRARQPLWDASSPFETAEFSFYGALAHAASCASAPADEKQQHYDAVVAHHRQLTVWAQHCPENFDNRAALVGAEIARIEGRELEAMRLYELAIQSARANGFVNNEALANELAARFYAACGFRQIADLYWRNARQCYLRWGADGKVRQLDDMHPHLVTPETEPVSGTMGAPVEHLDLATVIKVSQAVSGEMVLDKLLDTLMRTALEQAGAERGLLILSPGAEPRIAAEAAVAGDTVVVRLPGEPASPQALPQSVLQYVLRTRQSVILDDAEAQPQFSDDAYVRQQHARSVACVPLINQGRLTGALYLENNLTPRVFVPTRITMLKLLASQAAISLENTRLYRDHEQREAKIRRLVDANIIGIVVVDLEGRILEANDAFLGIVGYDRDDLTSGRLNLTDLTPPEWLDRQRHWMPVLKPSGSIEKPYEKEYFRKDGSRVPVLIGVAWLEESVEQGIAFVLDLSERKRAEAEARESDRRYREAQMELAHANRIATMGQLSASIAHEVKQPIAAMAANAAAALRWLAFDPPEMEEARDALTAISNDGNRAGHIIGRIQDLIKKTPPRRDQLEINGAIREIVELTRGEMVKSGVEVRTAFADGLPLIQADRVQLQQVVLNLVMNAAEAMSGVSEGTRLLLIDTGIADTGNGVLVTMRDSGPGLAPAALERIFDPFYSSKPSGLGLGLSICRSIIEAHAGTITADNGGVDGGARFIFTIGGAGSASSGL